MLAESTVIVAVFLLLVALPAGSYFYLHRSLVSQYETLSRIVRQETLQVCQGRCRPALCTLSCYITHMSVQFCNGAQLGLTTLYIIKIIKLLNPIVNASSRQNLL